ncbi:MAG: HK97 gp10 family phage protein [Desulfovibrio sp.]
MGIFSDQFERVMSRVQGAVDAEMREEVLPEAKRLCPVKTGALRDSLEVGVERDGSRIDAYLETDIPYAPYPEFGSHGRPGKAFMRGGAAVFDLQRVANRMKGGDS